MESATNANARFLEGIGAVIEAKAFRSKFSKFIAQIIKKWKTLLRNVINGNLEKEIFA